MFKHIIVYLWFKKAWENKTSHLIPYLNEDSLCWRYQTSLRDTFKCRPTEYFDDPLKALNLLALHLQIFGDTMIKHNSQGI